MLPIYKKHLSEEDLRAIIAFNQSPAGKRIAEKTPLIVQEIMISSQDYGKKIAVEIYEKTKNYGL